MKLEPVDAAIAAVIEHNHDQLEAEPDGGFQLGVQHQVAAVAHGDEHVPPGLRLFHAKAASDLVAHAGEPVLDMVAAGLAGAPQLVQLPRQAAGGADHDAARAGRAIDSAHHLRVGRQRVAGRCGGPFDRLVPAGAQPGSAVAPGFGRAVASEQLAQRLQPAQRVSHQRGGAMLAGVKRLDVELDQGGRPRQQRARPGGKITQPGAHCQDHVGLARKLIGGGAASDANGAHEVGTGPRQGALASLGFGHWDAMHGGELGQRRLRPSIDHAAPGHDQRAVGLPQQRGGALELRRVQARTARQVLARGEEGGGIIVGFGLHVLAQRQRDGAALRRVGQHLDCARQGGEELFRAGDAVPIARNRAEAVVHAGRAVAPILQLLQHRVGPAGGEHVTREQQDGQAVDMRHASGGEHVHRTRADGSGAGHHLPPGAGLGEGNRGMGHCLLVMGAEGGQRVARGIQRLAQRRHIAVAEDGPATGKQRCRLAVQVGALRCQVAHQRLGRRKPQRRPRRHAACPTASARPEARLASAASASCSAALPSANPARNGLPLDRHSTKWLISAR